MNIIRHVDAFIRIVGNGVAVGLSSNFSKGNPNSVRELLLQSARYKSQFEIAPSKNRIVSDMVGVLT